MQFERWEEEIKHIGFLLLYKRWLALLLVLLLALLVNAKGDTVNWYYIITSLL